MLPIKEDLAMKRKSIEGYTAMEKELIKLVEDLIKDRNYLLLQSDGIPRAIVNRPLVNKLEEIAKRIIQIMERNCEYINK